MSVYKLFFLNTLGYTSNKKILCVFNKVKSGDISAPPDERGNHVPANKRNEEVISMMKDHIGYCNPSISHYRKKHAPLCIYLPSELNVNLLYKYFCEMYPDIEVTYKTYWMQAKCLNISFANLGV